MAWGDHVILVVSEREPAARNLKDLIEFMDSPPVVIATPADWRRHLGRHRLDALFIGPDMSADEVDRLLEEIGKLDPNVPIVMMHEDDAA